MSKSKGNVVAPQKISDTLGADILRLWVASTDYSGELSISDEILKRVTESYRRIRNTLRFLLANTTDFDPTSDMIAPENLLELDRYALASMAALQTETLQHYQAFEFQPVMSQLQMYCSEDLGGFYLDILKDRLYTAGVTSLARRSAQTTIWHITQSLLRLLAPILSFTVEEAWAIFASPQQFKDSDETIFTQTTYPLPTITDSAALLDKYAKLRAIRADVVRQLEQVRMSGEIGSSLQAEVELRATGDNFQLLQGLGDELKFILITSAAHVTQVANNEQEAIIVTPSTHTKCERCWHYRSDVGVDAEHPELCGRCTSNLFGSGEVRHIA